jgi:putative RNA 2'-phosphotransferase
MRTELKRKSKFLSLVLRHRPEVVGLSLDANGWIAVSELLAGAERGGLSISREELVEIVETNEKRRFFLDAENDRIRANQGHSVRVDVELKPTTPPEVLYHGTAERNVDVIQREGLKPMQRQHVHLSADTETARKVGSRHGRPVIFRVAAARLHAAGTVFYRSENGVWLTDTVPPHALEVLD